MIDRLIDWLSVSSPYRRSVCQENEPVVEIWLASNRRISEGPVGSAQPSALLGGGSLALPLQSVEKVSAVLRRLGHETLQKYLGKTKGSLVSDSCAVWPPRPARG